MIEDDNKKLVEKYPFLLPRNIYTGEIPKNYCYSYTLFDAVPNGWKELFLKMCDEIRDELVKNDKLDKFRFFQIKEKYGSLRCYASNTTEKVLDIIYKYELLSEKICVECGKPATKISQGWVCPYCDDCANKHNYDYLTIDEYFGDANESI